MRTPRLSIIVPTLNEARSIAHVLSSIQELNQSLDLGIELIVADGGSQDNTQALAQRLADHVLEAPRGRARQMNAGARRASADYLLFLHADTELTRAAAVELRQALEHAPAWGRFDVSIQGRACMLPVIAFMMNRRSRYTGIATGDQAMFIRRDVFESLNGFADLPLMEDIELSKRLCRQHRPTCLRGPVVTSGRRWETKGVWATIWLMWCLRWRYWRGADAHTLAKAYQR